MLIDQTHKVWIRWTVLLAVIATAAYIPYHLLSLNGPSGGSWPGLIYGIAGSALMLYAGLLSLRKKIPTWRIGRAETWMRGHLWLGLLSLLLICFHAGFRFGGPLTTVLMWLLIGIILSGVWGLALQQFLPRLMMTQVPAETIYEQIDHVVEQLIQATDSLIEEVCGPLGLPTEEAATTTVAAAVVKSEGVVKGRVVKSKTKRASGEPVAGSEPLKEFYLTEARPFLQHGSARLSRLGQAKPAATLFDHLRTLLPTSLHQTVDELAAACDERRQLSLQVRLHHWLHGWLFVHVPLSMAVLVLTIWHIVMALRY
ncbi:MAG: hypothetical protein RMM98_08695 [Acidobacteriota bacterium]|nr:hypothetical protein [Blastocatellia bacterium]MDW8239681.1 hypothetical protein [Acidobacteriota bacterium]